MSIRYLFAGLLLLIATNVNAIVIPFSFTPSSSNTFTTTLSTPTTTTSAVNFTLNVAGDFNSDSESLSINIENLFIQTVLDGNTSNDTFNFANNDDPISTNAPSPIVSSSSIISQSLWSQIIADGVINLSFTTTSGVDCCSGPDVNHLSGQFTDGVVPVPAPLALLGLGLVAIGWARRKSA